MRARCMPSWGRTARASRRCLMCWRARAVYDITDGSVLCNGEDLAAMAPEERAAKGVFLAMQYPVEIPGVTTMMFLKSALNAQRRARGAKDLDAIGILKQVRQKAGTL